MAEDHDQHLSSLEVDLDHLKALYEQYFSGILRIQPTKEHDAFTKKFERLGPVALKSTSARFRHNQLKSRYLQLKGHWEKTLKKIEEGTHNRDLFLLRAKERYKTPTTASNPTISTKPKTSTGPLIPDATWEKLYTKFKKLSVGGTKKVPSKDEFKRVVEKQIETMKKKNPGKKLNVKVIQGDDKKVTVRVELKTQ